MDNVTISPLTDTPKVIGEGPHWIEKEKSLLYLDINTSTLYKYYTETGREQRLYVEDGSGTGQFTSFVIPFEGADSELAVGVGRSLSSVTWIPSDPDEGRSRATPLVFVDKEKDVATRLNDGKCDPRGRLWAGTMALEDGVMSWPLHKGSLYQFDSNLTAHEKADQISISNGLGWRTDLSTMYFVDSLAYSVDAFDYSDDTGDIRNKRVVLDFKKEGIAGLPDGMTLDTNGHLWVACFGGWQVLCVDPEVGKVVRTLKLPSSNITSCCWGGPDYSTLYVTSGTKDRPSSELREYPDSGKTFSVTGLNAKGFPPIDYSVDLSALHRLKSQ